MTKTLALAVLVVIVASGCKKPADPAAASVSCHIANQQICNEYPSPTPAGDQEAAVACSSGSGVLAHPAACPTAGFLGKCTTGTGARLHVERRYTGADAKYAQDFCVNTAHGVWSATF